MIRCRMGVASLARAAVALACLGAISGCGDDDGGAGPTPTPSTSQASPSRTSTPLSTPSASPTPTAGSSSLAGDYTATFDLDGSQAAHLNLAVAEDDSASGTLEIVEISAALVRQRFGTLSSNVAVSAGLVSISGSIDPGAGTFHFSGHIAGPDGAIPFDLSGALPSSPGDSGSVTLMVAGQSYTSMISAGPGPTPLPTSAGDPTPTPIAGGCAHGVFEVSFASIADSNLMHTAPLTLGKVNAVEASDGVGSYVWAITANPCNPQLGAVAHGIIVQASGIATPIQAGTYALNSSTPPFLGVTFQESLSNPLSPGGNFLHAWGSTGGTLTLTDVGGGAFHFHVSAPMGEHPLLHGGTGTFDLEIDGTIDQVGL